MERREFTKAVASLPVIPSVPSFGKNEPEKDARTHGEEDEFWEVSSAWMQESDWGKMILVKNDEVVHEWEYDQYSLWQKATLLNAHTIADCEYVADLFSMNLHELYIDSPYFHSTFKGEAGEVRIRQGKYSDYDYKYYIRTEHKEREYGSNDLENMIIDIGRKLSEDGQA